MRAATLRLIVLGVCAILAPSVFAYGGCYQTEEIMPYLVCTDWWDGTRTCHWQQGLFEVIYCNGTDGTVVGPVQPPGGGSTRVGTIPAPDCQIVGISDQNPDQPILSIQANAVVLDMTLTYDGYPNQTVEATDTLALQPVNYFRGGNTSVGVQCRNAVNVYSTPVMTVSRWAGVYDKHESVYGVWTRLNLSGEPEQYTGDWDRRVTLLTAETSYSVPTFGARNGQYEHDAAEDHLYPVGTTPMPAWESTYFVNRWSGGQSQHWGWACAHASLHGQICFDNINEFSSPGAPNGKAVITDMDVPFQSSFGVTLFTGREVFVGPR